MGSLFLWLLRLFARGLLSLRYRVVLTGLDRIEAGRGMLILPNHPAEIDPVLLEVLLWTKLHPRPVVVEDFFHAPGLHGLLALMRALPIPNIESGRSAFKTRRIDSSLGAILEGVQRGDSFLIYPAGALQRADRQTIGGASAVHAMVQRMPEVPVLLVRTKGLWGSSFSWIARNGRPNLGACLLHGAWALLANGLFFAPRRTVEIEVAPAPNDFPRATDRTSFNRWLDAWYFPQGDVQPVATRYYRWSRKRPKLAGVRKHASADIADVPEPVRQGVLEEFARMRSCRPDQITPEMDLRRDLGLDSLEMTDVFFWLDARFGVSDVTLPELTTVGATMLLAHGRAHAAGDIAVSAAPRMWRANMRRPALVPIDGATLPEAFLRSCDRMGSSVACADDIAGVMTYKRLKLAALALARAIRDIPGDRIGIMLPASVGASVSFFATLLAGKTPIMINWTLGARNIRHVIDVSGISTILTSLAFVDNVDTLPVDEIEPLLVFLEHVRRDKIKWRAKLSALFAATRSTDRLLASLGLDRISPDAPAFVLFTSGSESVPKGVPLTHANILANIRASIEALQFDTYETVLSFLPPFHSFGLTTTTIMPVLAGLRVAFYPNPTEARRIAYATQKWHATLMAGTPSFLKAIFKAARPGQLASLRLMVTGAERAPEELFSMVEHIDPQARLLEGYGITECSPVVSVVRPDEQALGVGRPLPGVELLVVDLDTHQPVPQGSRGLILVHGPSVFPGYLGNVASPFIEIAEKQWYNTGDLGYLGPDGSLVIAGRLKRFIKIGGEMISLPAIEEALTQTWPAGEDAPSCAVAAVEPPGQRPHIALFTILNITVDMVNTALRTAGLGALVRVASVHRLDAIPLLGTGKTDYRALNGQLARSLAEQA